jgi:Cytochrome P450
MTETTAQIDWEDHASSALFNSDTAFGGLSRAGFQPFGRGARMCIGYRRAIAERKVFIHHMVLNYEWTLLPDSQDETCYLPMPMPVDGAPLDVKRRDCATTFPAVRINRKRSALQPV